MVTVVDGGGQWMVAAIVAVVSMEITVMSVAAMAEGGCGGNGRG